MAWIQFAGKHETQFDDKTNHKLYEYSGAFTFLCCRTAYGISPDRNLRDRQVNLAPSLKMFAALTIWFQSQYGTVDPDYEGYWWVGICRTHFQTWRGTISWFNFGKMNIYHICTMEFKVKVASGGGGQTSITAQLFRVIEFELSMERPYLFNHQVVVCC